MWGDNSSGQLGDGTYENHNRPVKVLENVRFVSLGGGLGEIRNHSGAVTEDGSLYMWGNNWCGQLGDGTNDDHNIPVKVLENVQSVSLGEDHSGAVTEDGNLYMWGTNWDGELGDGTYDNHNIPVKVLENVQSVSLGGSHSGAVTKDGNLYTWGTNDWGELGYGTNDDYNSNIPVKVLENVQFISLGGESGLGDSHSGAVTKDGSLYMWGANFNGELGDGTLEPSPTHPPYNSNSNGYIPWPVAKQKITYHSSAIKKGKVVYGSSFSLNAKTSGKGKLTYKSSNKKIFSVNSKGKVKVNGYGSAYISIKASSRNGYKAASRKFKLIAVPRQGKITKAEWQKSGVYFRWRPEKTSDGYEYALAYNKKFSGQSRTKIKKAGLLLTKYKTGTKKMFLKVRTYKKAGKKTYYGKWSKPRMVKLKKSKKNGKSSYTIIK